MSVGRNDPCLCGSGKKYKKCCLNKEDVIALTNIQKEQFHRQKNALFTKLKQFVHEYTTFEQFHQLKLTFKQRTKGIISQEEEEGYFTFWLYFFHRFENGLRLVDWFYEENAWRITQEERARIKGWTTLQPRLLQAIDHSEANIYFQDMLTGEIFPVKREEENMSFFIPWMSTLGMVEPYGDTFYFNGIRPNGSPDDLKRSIKEVNKLTTINNELKEITLIDFYPELLAEFLKKDHHLDGNDEEIVEYNVTYKINNETSITEFLHTLPNFQMNKWTDEEKEIVWVGNHRIYEDNACNGNIQLADVYGQIIIKPGQLQMKSLEEQRLEQMKELMQKMKKDLFLDTEEEIVIGTSIDIARNVMISAPEDAPECFSLYAQSDLVQLIDEPQQMFNQSSIRDLVKNNQKFDVEMWLRQSEYGIYHVVLERFKTVEVTADFNQIRADLGMPLSPFVTGGTSRETKVTYVERENSAHELLEKKIPLLEKLGFTPESLDRFYTTEFIYFFQNKTDGKSADTNRKYREVLNDLRKILELKSITSWDQCGVTFWRTVVMTDYPKLYNEVDELARKEFVYIVREFLSWLDEAEGKSHFYKSLLFLEQLE